MCSEKMNIESKFYLLFIFAISLYGYLSIRDQASKYYNTSVDEGICHIVVDVGNHHVTFGMKYHDITTGHNHTTYFCSCWKSRLVDCPPYQEDQQIKCYLVPEKAHIQLYTDQRDAMLDKSGVHWGDMMIYNASVFTLLMQVLMGVIYIIYLCMHKWETGLY